MFPKGSVYIGNTAAEIAEGINAALMKKERLAREMKEFKAEKYHQWDKQYKAMLDIIYGGSVKQGAEASR